MTPCVDQVSNELVPYVEAPSSASDQARSTERTMSRNTGCTLERSLAASVEHGRPNRRIQTCSDAKVAAQARKLTTDRVSRFATRTTERRIRACEPRRFGPITKSTLKPLSPRSTEITTAERLSFLPSSSPCERGSLSDCAAPLFSEDASYASGGGHRGSCSFDPSGPYAVPELPHLSVAGSSLGGNSRG